MSVCRTNLGGIAFLAVGLMVSGAMAQSPRVPLPAGNFVTPAQTCPMMVMGQQSPGVYYYYAIYYDEATPCNLPGTAVLLTGNYTCPQYCPDCVTSLRIANDGAAKPFPGRKKAVEPTHDPRLAGDGATVDVSKETLEFAEFLPAEDSQLRFYLKDQKGRQYVCYRVRVTLAARGAGREFPLEREIFFGYEMRSDATVPQTVYRVGDLEQVESGIAENDARVFRCDLPQGILRTQYGRNDRQQVLLLQVK
jgi:hypothetical protein